MVMEGKKGRIVVTMLLVLTLCGCGAKATAKPAEPVKDTGSMESQIEITKTDESYPMIAYINNVNYYGTDKICENVPRKSPDGTIETFVDKEIMPDALNSANFGSEHKKLEYMFLEDKQLIIHIGDNWYYFEEKTD